jgi:hypothetical protein
MNIWIVTIGSSDVQLDSDTSSRKKGRNEKQRSDKVWRYWYEDTQLECYDIFKPKQPYPDLDESYRIEARVLGSVYQSSSSAIQDEIWQYLTFPLLDSFVEKLQHPHPDAIAVLLTDQSELFKDDYIRQKPKCPYWQDTCTLKLILERYFKDKFPDVKCEWISLPPSDDKGLADWDYVLKLVGKELGNFKFDGREIKNEEIKTVYVSHQAGTPAISSAVQFISLARFGERVKFLVSNEYEKKPLEPIDSSEYLKGIKFQEAKALLNNHDYAGVKDLVDSYLTPETKILLNAAIEWNFAKFDDFAKTLLHHPDSNLVKKINDRTKQENWWWTAYEEGYLAVVRLQQKNTVEAMFHSFRAVEGLIREWAVWKYQPQIRASNLKQPRTLYFHNENINMSTQLNHWFKKYHSEKHSNVGLFGEPLFELLKASHPPGKWHNNSDIKTVAKITKEERNSTFHQLLGLQELELFTAWDTKNPKDWEKTVLSCLNFISGQNFDLSIECPLEEASLMFKVHKKLEKAIARYEIQT